MGVHLLADEFAGDFLPAHEIDQIVAADRDHLRGFRQPRRRHPIGTCRDAGPHKVVADLLRGEIQNGGKVSFCGKAFKRTASRARGMEHGNFEPTFFQFRFQGNHIAKDRLAKGDHADQQLVAGGVLTARAAPSTAPAAWLSEDLQIEFRP